MNKTIVCAAALLLTGVFPVRTSQAIGTPAPITFATLDAHTQIKVDYESQGCYHHVRWHFTFTRNAVLRVADADLEEDPYVQTSSAALNEMVQAHPTFHSKPVGALSLTGARAIQLDNLLAYYRYLSLHPPTGSSTTHNKITCTFLRNGKVVRAETFEESSGLAEASPYALELLESRAPADERKMLVNLTNFWQLHTELTAAAKHTQAGH